MTHICDGLWLVSFLNHLQLGTAVPLVVTDIDGHLSCLQALKAVALAATPLVDVLGGDERNVDTTSRSHTLGYIRGQSTMRGCVFVERPPSGLAHLAQVDDEAISLVEAGPGHGDLRGSDCSTALDLQQALDVHVVGHHVLEARGHSSFLRR